MPPLSAVGRSVLVVKLAAIGDVVMALPMVTALRAQDPATRIDWMCGRVAAPLLACVEGIDRVIAVDERGLFARSPVAKAAALVRAWRAVAGRRYDTLYFAHSDARYRMLGWPVVARRRVSLADGSTRRGIDPRRLHSDVYAALVHPDAAARRYGPPAVRVDVGADVASRLERGNPDGLPMVALTPGGSRNVARDIPLRRWPLERYAALCERLRERGFRVVITGDASDAWTRSAFRPEQAIDLVGRTDIAQLVALFRRCAVVVAHDSGPMHLARLSGAPVVALLGPTPPTMFFRPDERAGVLWPGGALPCAPCYDGFDFAACADNRCMRMIEVDEVLARVTVLAATRSAPAAAG